MPYAVKEGGWLGLFILFLFGAITCYTGILLKRCLESSPDLHTYPDIGQAAFGFTGRLWIHRPPHHLRKFMETINILPNVSNLILRVFDLMTLADTSVHGVIRMLGGVYNHDE